MVLLWGIGSALSVVGCRVDADDFKHTMVLEKPWQPDVSAPEGDTPEETRLYQLLYAGEHGAEAHALGQRVRMKAWLRTVHLSDAELMELAMLAVEVRKQVAADRADLAGLAAREVEVLQPIYARLEAALLQAGTTNAELEALALELAESREALYGDHEIQAARRDRIRELIRLSAVFLAKLTHEQRLQLNSCRFVLNEHAAPLTNPGSYASLVGMIWDRGDFSALQTGEDHGADGPLDLGGLWALEHLRAPPSGYMVDSARAGMMLLVLMDPAFIPVISDILTTRELSIPSPEAVAANAPRPPASTDGDAP